MPNKPESTGSSDTAVRVMLAWGAHLYTSLGLLAAAAMAILLLRGGDPESIRWVFRLMVLATLIDATDGWLARRLEVRRLAPRLDGRRLDDIIDFQTYTTLPLLLIWRTGLLPEAQSWWLLLPLLASAYGFAQVEAKTEDGYFLGFPSYWNIVAFYLYYLRLPAPWGAALLVALALLTLVPSRYLYPSQGGGLNRLTLWLGTPWALSVVLALLPWPENPRPVILISLIFPLYYLAASWTVSVRRWRA